MKVLVGTTVWTGCLTGSQVYEWRVIEIIAKESLKTVYTLKRERDNSSYGYNLFGYRNESETATAFKDELWSSKELAFDWLVKEKKKKIKEDKESLKETIKNRKMYKEYSDNMVEIIKASIKKGK